MKTQQPTSSIGNWQLQIGNASRQSSAALGAWLLAVPLFFLSSVAMKCAFHPGVPFRAMVEDAVNMLDKSSGVSHVSAIIFLGFSFAAIAANLRSVLRGKGALAANPCVERVAGGWINVAIVIAAMAIAGIYVVDVIAIP